MAELLSSNANKFDLMNKFDWPDTDDGGCYFAVPMDMYCSTDPDAWTRFVKAQFQWIPITGMSHPPDEQLFDRFEGV